VTMRQFKRVDILGCPFDAASYDETVGAIRNSVLTSSRLQVVPGSIDFVMKTRRDPVFARELRRADLVIADGVPIVWAASMLKDPLRGRVSGTDLVWSCAQITEETGRPMALVGGEERITGLAAVRMRERHPGAQIHVIPTPFPLGEKESIEVVDNIRALNAGIVLVALGAPRQERWIQANLEKCGASVGIGIGSAFDIISGDKPRAPRFMRDNGFEWLHRLLLEPGRLGRRYIIEDSPFIYQLAVELLKRKFTMKGGLHEEI